MKKNVVVTGTSSGIGRAIAQTLLAQDYQVLGVCRRAAELQHPHYIPVACDFRQLDALGDACKRIELDHPTLHAVVCAGGMGLFGHLEQLSPATIRDLIDVNLTANILLVRGLLPVLKRNERSFLVMIGSEAALRAGKEGSVYCATKFALRGFAQALRHECAKSGLKVTLIHPGMVDTPFFDQLHFRPGPHPDNVLTPQDVADAVLTVLSMRDNAVIDELTLSPLTHAITFAKNTKGNS